MQLIADDFFFFFLYRLTLTLSCAMNFMIYPHDTQECKLQMESRKFNILRVRLYSNAIRIISFETCNLFQCRIRPTTWYSNGIRLYHWSSTKISNCPSYNWLKIKLPTVHKYTLPVNRTIITYTYTTGGYTHFGVVVFVL